MNMKLCLRIVVLVALLAAAGCAPRRPVAPPVQPVVPAAEVRDVLALPQDLRAYLPAVSEAPLLPAEAQLVATDRYLERFFAPWDSGGRQDLRQMAAGGLAFRRKKTFGENLRERKDEWYAGLEANADLGVYPTANRRAVAVAHASLRQLPTDAPVFYDPALPGEGFPFDMAQQSGVWAGTPLYVSHISRDGAWLLVEAPYAAGWVRTTEVAWAGEEFVRLYRTGQYAAVVRDDVPLRDEAGVYRVHGRVGMVLPMDGRGGVLLPAADRDRGATAVRVVTETGSLAQVPAVLTPARIAAVGNEMMGEPYGWGGYLGNRDCSAMLRDLFAPFGLWLPRNSQSQAKVGTVIPIGSLSPEDKTRTILSQGVPFLTLLTMKGHIMLYVGERGGLPVVFHDVWGLRTVDPRSPNGIGRKILGGAVVTTVSPGLELPDLKLPEGNLLTRIETMTILGTGGVNGGASGNVGGSVGGAANGDPGTGERPTP